MANGLKSITLSDNWTLIDGLKFSVFIPALMDILQNADTPLTVGVFGTWGTGKTSLLRMLEKEIHDKGLTKFRPVWFTAWKYDKQDALWRAFILEVIDGLYPKENGKRISLKDLKDPGQKKGVKFLDILAQNLYQTVSWQGEASWSLDIPKTTKELIKLPLWLALHLAKLSEAAKDIGIKPDLAKLISREAPIYYMQQLTFMEEFEKKFQEALGKILGSEGRLVVFVDDLDRCLPEKAVEILEAIKLFLNVPQTIFVLGMDREIVCRGIESHYWSMFQPKENEQSLDLPVDGDSYLHKLIQLPFNLPLLDEKARLKYIGTLNDESRMNLDVITRQVFARGLLPNPRQVKRALNIFNLLRKIAEAQEKQNLIPQKSIAWPLLAKTVLIQSQWPELYSKWCQIPTLVQELEKEYGKKPLTVREQFYGPTDEALTGTLGTSRTEETLKRITVSRLPEDVFLADFINNRQKYALLNELINFPKETGKGQKRARFSGLTDSELRRYLGLVGTSEEKPIKPREISLPPDISSMLQSGDPAFLREALSLIQEQEKNKNGALHQMVKQILLQNATNPELVPSVRASAADALDGIGYFPDDLFQFMQIPKEGEPPFWIARYPVTNIQYERFLEAPDFSEIEFWMNFSKYDEKNRLMDENWGDKGYTWLKENMNKMKVVYPYAWQDQRFGISRKGVPVVGISWFEANAYARWLQHHWNELVEGKNNPEIKFEKIHLPTEAEWVLAAGGEENGRYPWDEKAEPAINDKNVKVVLSNSNTFESGIQRTTPVWMNPLGVSPHGVMDMCGNVWEWQANHDREDSKALALRGGSWLINQGGARVVDRHDSSPSSRYDIIGFRVVCLPS